ncbi:CaiB/BaiF CoA transferase family protein [Pseudomonas citrulli]|jgi:alpha-methylacyl-CoA racemase|uniref:CaiB/BaiF CoA-transferase family protein n=1 Tax=Pseudomonas lurida TaxID=244566 RepID=A0ABY9FPB5_9PSED|nr:MULTISPECIES: CaiB/BaiF CoA-transferase family protein [Pseudomonas]QDH66517.1 CoA transferase [Pseudomonas azotoformans]WLG54854.1 CaiB/BaiF CoA-transferase family protein [Pseudomonas extremorientalis]WLH05090.1 CaiB/BaiF CoA-transferase family protein [Pseudomonas lurida]
MAGPLTGFKVVELAGIGPGPMCAMLLADLGATVIRVDRKEPVKLGIERPLQYNTLLRNRYAIALDLKDPMGVETVLKLVEQADALIEGFRPGVTERLGLGPEDCLVRNPQLVYGRMTGWGQTGPMAQYAGHDLNYLALTGVLDAIGREGQPPSIPLNLLGDYAGGSLYLALGILAGVLEARQSGKGQVVDAAIVDGAAHLATTFFGMLAAGIWKEGRGTNITDSGSPFYDCYPCKDGKFISIGPIESKFYDQLLSLMDIDPLSLGVQMDRNAWPQAKKILAERFLCRSRDEWVSLLEASDACAAGVLSFNEAVEHPHLKARGTFIEVDGVVQPAPAPRFSRSTPAAPIAPQPVTPENSNAALAAWFSSSEISALRSSGIID